MSTMNTRSPRGTRRQRRRGLARTLSLYSTVPMIVVMAITSTITVILVNNNMDTLVENNSSNTLALVEELIDASFTGTVQSYLRGRAESNRSLMEYYHELALAGDISPGEARATVEQILLDPEYGRVGTTGYLAAVSTAGILDIHPFTPGADASSHEFMQQAMAMRTGYLEYEWQNPGETETRLKAGYLAYFQPWDLMIWVSSYKSEFAALMDLEEIDSRISRISVDDEGYILVYDGEQILRAGIDHLSVGPLHHQEDAILQSTPGGRIRIETRTEPVLGWTIATVVPLASYESMTRLLRLIVVATVVIAWALVYLFVRTSLRRILQPVQSISAAVDQVSRGDLTATVTVYSDDEIRDIGDHFNRMIGEFAAVLRKIRSVIGVLTDSVQNLSASTQEIASTSNEQAAAVKEVLSTMEDADRLSKGVETRIQEVARIAGATKDTVEEGFGLIKTSLSKMEEIRTTNADTITGIKTLGDRIESIWEIVNIINGIADQTKIIAFNAELEAAAAGEAGKNFQIVAGEIRRLADGTVESTNEIKVKINEIQHASDKLIIASEQGTQRIREGWDVSTNIRGVFEQVLSSSEITATSAGEISRSTRMQVSSFEQVFETLKQISESIDSFVESTAYTTEVSDHLKEIADSFRQNVESFQIGEDS